MTNDEKYKQVLKDYWKKVNDNIENANSEKEADTFRHFGSLLEPCCHNENRGMNGGCETCGSPCF